MKAMSADTVLDFWFGEIKPARWWKKDRAFDELIRDRFGEIHQAGANGELLHWRARDRGRLAEIIVLDQFSRNIYRDTEDAFACDGMALVLAQEAVARRVDRNMTANEKAFLYMPYMHSESPLIHEEAVRLYSQKGLERNLDFELRHKKIIDRFGRYPHRNRILGRVSTGEETEFLKQPGSGF